MSAANEPCGEFVAEQVQSPRANEHVNALSGVIHAALCVLQDKDAIRKHGPSVERRLMCVSLKTITEDSDDEMRLYFSLHPDALGWYFVSVSE